MTDNERLTQALRDRADTAGGHPLALEDIKHSANRMKWQRRAATTAVAAAVLAIATPIGYTLVDSPETVPASPITAPAPQGPKEVTLTVNEPPVGEAPGVVYVYNKQIVEPGGQTTDVGFDYSQLAAFGDGWIGLRSDERGNALADVLDVGGQVEDSFRSSYGLAVSSEGDQVAAFELRPDGGVLTRYSDGQPTQTWEFAKGVVIEPVGILGDGAVVYTPEVGDPVVMVARADGQTQPLPGAIAAGGVADATGRITVMTSVDELVPESCWNIFGTTGGEQWQTPRCEHSLGRFSPGERFLVGHPSYRDGIGDGVASIVDPETGEALVKYDTPNGSHFAGVIWEDDTHLLAVVYSSRGWHVYRLDTEGNVENAIGEPLPGPAEMAPVLFGATP